MSEVSIPLRSVGPEPPRHAHAAREPYDAPYRLFLATSLLLAIGGGFLLALLLPLARALEWDWGTRWDALVQAHGQLQLVGFTGLFTAGMALRLMPRFSGRPLAFPRVIPWVIPSIAAALIVRAVAQPAGAGALRDVGLLASALLLVAGAVALAGVILRTIVHPDSRAQATRWFFSFGSAGFVIASVLNLLWVVQLWREDLNTVPVLKDSALNVLLEFGFILMFLGGVGLRAVPNLVGRPRPERSAMTAAIMLASGVGAYVGVTLWSAYDELTPALARLGDAGLILIGAACVTISWLSGVFRPSANRVAAPSQVQFWFVRAAMSWLAAGGIMLAWFGARAFAGPRIVDAFAMDAVRHAIAVGVLTNMIVGMAMLVVPEFAGRRLQHPNERWLVVSMIVALNVAAALRVWPALEGVHWIGVARYWPMAIAGTLTEAVLLVFAFMFLQSWREQRPRDWATPQAIARLRGTRPGVSAP